MSRPARPLPRGEPPAPGPVVAPPSVARPPPPAVTRDEVDLLLRRAGLTLNAGQKADLAVSFQHLVTLASKLPRERPLSDEPAFVFLPEPQPPAQPAPRRPAKAAARKPTPKSAKAGPKTATKGKVKPKVAPRPKAKLKPKPARVAPKVVRRR